MLINVIIADDSQDIRELLQHHLEKNGCKVVAMAENGEQAIEIINKFSPDIAFIDIEMPLKNGHDVLEFICEHNVNVYAVIVSAHSTMENLMTTANRGAQNFIVKPHTQQKVQSVLSEYRKQLKK